MVARPCLKSSATIVRYAHNLAILTIPQNLIILFLHESARARPTCQYPFHQPPIFTSTQSSLGGSQHRISHHSMHLARGSKSNCRIYCCSFFNNKTRKPKVECFFDGISILCEYERQKFLLLFQQPPHIILNLPEFVSVHSHTFPCISYIP